MKPWCDYCDNGCERCDPSNSGPAPVHHRAPLSAPPNLSDMQSSIVSLAVLLKLLSSEDDRQPATHIKVGDHWVCIDDCFETAKRLAAGAAQILDNHQRALQAHHDESVRILQAAKARAQREFAEVDRRLRELESARNSA